MQLSLIIGLFLLSAIAAFITVVVRVPDDVIVPGADSKKYVQMQPFHYIRFWRNAVVNLCFASISIAFMGSAPVGARFCDWDAPLLTIIFGMGTALWSAYDYAESDEPIEKDWFRRVWLNVIFAMLVYGYAAFAAWYRLALPHTSV